MTANSCGADSCFNSQSLLVCLAVAFPVNHLQDANQQEFSACSEMCL